MIIKKSRYKNTKIFDPDEDGKEVFPGLRSRNIGPATGIVEHEVVAGDRLDHLAQHYYNNDHLWWRIVDANPDVVFAENLLDEEMAGQAILIPKASE